MIKILLIDHSLDSEPSVWSLLSALPADQFHVQRCSGYHSILDGFRGQATDICVIDSGTGNGLKLLAQARSVGLSTPIVLVTANDASEVVAAIRNGAADCLVRDQLTPASIEGSICCVVDQAQSAALQAERGRRYLALCDSLEEIIYTHDLNGHITSMNAAGLGLLGYSLVEILRMEVSEIVAAESKPLVSHTTNLMLDAQTRALHEVCLVTKSGKSLAMRVNAHPIYQLGNPVEIQVLATLIGGPRALYPNLSTHPGVPTVCATSYRPQMSRAAETRAS